MIIIRHRQNLRRELEETSTDLGIEVDIRSRGSELVIHHEPFVQGELFEDWIESYAHRLLILNVKEEGLEERLLAIMAGRGIEEFFFLDQSFPFLIRTARQGERRCAVRVSEYESVDTALNLSGMVEWVWVDCFTRFPLDGDAARTLQAAGMKLCLVSPELQGRSDPSEIEAMRNMLVREKIMIEAVCTKEPESWR